MDELLYQFIQNSKRMMEKGQSLERRKIVRNMLKNNEPDEKIMKYLDITQQELQEIIEQINF